jgi:hypothetical protein
MGSALRGGVVAGPVLTAQLIDRREPDAPWTRMTVITDPQGATFTASQFVLENKDL